MEYWKINLLDNTLKMWVKINDDPCGLCNADSQTKFITFILKSSLCDYSDAYMFVKGTVTITGEGEDDAPKQADERNEGVIFKVGHHSLFIKINNRKIDTAKDSDL